MKITVGGKVWYFMHDKYGISWKYAWYLMMICAVFHDIMYAVFS